MDNNDRHELVRLQVRIDEMHKRQSEMYYHMMGSIDATGKRTPGALQNQDAIIVTIYGDVSRNVLGHERRIETVEARLDAMDKAWLKLVGIATGASAILLFLWDYLKDLLHLGKK